MELFNSVAEKLINLQMITFLVLLIWRRKKLSKQTNFFIAAMSFTFVANALAKFYIDLEYGDNNVFIINFGVNFLTFLMYYLYYFALLEKVALKRAVLVIIGLFLAAYFASILFDKDFMLRFPTKFYFYETILLLITIAFFLYETFTSDRILKLGRYFPFWVSLGLLIMYVGLLPILFIGTKENAGMSLDVFYLIMFLINIISYIILIRGVLVSDHKHF